VVVVDVDDGCVVASASSPHPSTTPPRSEQDPSAWWSALTAAWEQCRPAAASVAAIAIAGQQHGLVALDGDGMAVHPAKLWNDTESAPQAEALVTELGAEAWARRCGSVPGPSFTVTKLAWLRDVRPEAMARVRRILLPHDWLTWRLLGRPAQPVTDRGDASGTGWWSPANGRADEGLLALAGGDLDWLPTVIGPADTAGAAVELMPGALVGPGTGDNMGAALGLGLVPGDIAVSFGTSGTAFAVSTIPTCDANGAVAGFADAAGRYLPLVCTLNATKVTDWAVRMAGRTAADLDTLAAASPPGARGVVLVPHLDGERTPHRPGATGAITGIRTTTTPSDLARAAVEGVVCGLLYGIEALAACGVDVSGRLLIVGGGARSVAYRQVLADLAQRQVIAPDPSVERVALGAAAQAAAVLGATDPGSVGARWAGAERDGIATDPSIDAATAAHIRSRFASAVDAA
jgi:xylulokinase